MTEQTFEELSAIYGEDNVEWAWDKFADLHQEEMSSEEAEEFFVEEIAEILEPTE